MSIKKDDESDIIGEMLSAFAMTTVRDKIAILLFIVFPLVIIPLVFVFPPKIRFFVAAHSDSVTLGPISSPTERGIGSRSLEWQIPNPTVGQIGEVTPPASFGETATIEFNAGQILEINRINGDYFRIEVVGGISENATAFTVVVGETRKSFDRANYIEFASAETGIVLPFRAEVTVGKEVQAGRSKTSLLRSGSLYIETYENWPSASGLKTEMRRELFTGERVSSPGVEVVGFLEVVKSSPIFASYSLFGSSVTISKFGVSPYQITETLYSKILTSPLIVVLLGVYAALPTLLLSVLIFLVRRRSGSMGMR